MNNPPIYLDYAAATPIDERVIAAMQPFLVDKFYNPSSPYAPAVGVRREYEAAKDRLAHTFGATGGELVMTAGATESINLVFQSVGGHVVSSTIEHKAVIEAAKQHEYTFVEVGATARVDPEVIRAAIRPDTQLVSIGLANSELGTIQPLRHIAEVVAKERRAREEKGDHTPLLFHADASQGMGLVDINVARLGVDLLTLNAAKVYGPKQVGLLWQKPSVALHPTIVGGGQERGLRSGTENVAGVVGFALAAELASRRRDTEVKRLGGLRDMLEKQLLETFPDAIITGSRKHRLANYLHISFPRIDAERIIFMLEMQGIYVATGSACSANKGTASHVLMALGLSDDVIGGSLRITLGHQTTDGGIKQAAKNIIEAIQYEYDRMGGK